MTRFEPFYLDDLDVAEVIEEVAKSFGFLFLGAAVGMRVMGKLLLNRLCLTQATFRGPSILTGEGCAGTQAIVEQQVLQWLGVGVVLLILAIALMVYGRDDNE